MAALLAILFFVAWGIFLIVLGRKSNPNYPFWRRWLEQTKSDSASSRALKYVLGVASVAVLLLVALVYLEKL